MLNTTTPSSTQIADPFHVMKLAKHVLDETRRRVQNDTLGHPDRKTNPLNPIRKLMMTAHERLNGESNAKLRGLLKAGEPNGEVRMA